MAQSYFLSKNASFGVQFWGPRSVKIRLPGCRFWPRSVQENWNNICFGKMNVPVDTPGCCNNEVYGVVAEVASFAKKVASRSGKIGAQSEHWSRTPRSKKVAKRPFLRLARLQFSFVRPVCCLMTRLFCKWHDFCKSLVLRRELLPRPPPGYTAGQSTK